MGIAGDLELIGDYTVTVNLKVEMLQLPNIDNCCIIIMMIIIIITTTTTLWL
jgi:hypothetical protein